MLGLILKKEQVINLLSILLVGQFHSTKIIEFTMYCHLCGNPIKCETDPENCDYNFKLGAHRIVHFKYLVKLNTENATDMEFMPDPEEVMLKNNISSRKRRRS